MIVIKINMTYNKLALLSFFVPTVLYGASWYMYKTKITAASTADEKSKADALYYVALVAQVVSLLFVFYRFSASEKKLTSF